MHNGKKLWSIFGPLIVACLLVVLLFSLPISKKHSAAIEHKAAVSLSPVVFKNQSIKQQALSDKHTHYVPFFGSSELRRMDRFHPSVMAARYHNYTPFLFGSRGTQSLPQFFNINSMETQMRNNKAVYIISPQWFTKQGVQPPAFKYYNGELANLNWLQHANPKSPYDRYIATRLIAMLGKDGTVSSYAKKIAEGKSLSSFDMGVIRFRLNMLVHEDAIFSGFQLNNNYGKHILPNVKKLPQHYNYNELYDDAMNEAARDTNNNRFGIKNSFYTQRVKKNLAKTKGSQRNFNYTKSPEYGDLEVVLNQFKNTNSNVLFIIPPVNSKWEKYTGMDMNMYYQSVEKIKFQLRQQGFNYILDLSHDGDKPGFMEDTIHIGWAGWVKVDKATNSFISNKQPQPHYQINSKFLSPEWTNLTPTPGNLQKFQEKLH